MRTSIAWLDRRRGASARRDDVGAQRRAGGDEELLADDVDAGDELRHAVLHLEPRVDLEEPERAVGVEQELAGRRVAQPGGLAEPDRQRVELPPLLRGRARAPAPPRRASGDGAAASSRARRARRRGRARRRAAAPRRGARAGSRARGTPTRRRTPTPPRAIRRRAPPAGPRRASTRRMPRPPPPAAALTSSGNPMPSAVATIAGDLVRAVDGRGLERPGHRRHADLRREPAGVELVAERLDGRGRRPDEDEARVLDRARERRPLGQEPVARVDGLRAGRDAPRRRPRRSAGSSRSAAPGRAGPRRRRAGRAPRSASASL